MTESSSVQMVVKWLEMQGEPMTDDRWMVDGGMDG